MITLAIRGAAVIGPGLDGWEAARAILAGAQPWLWAEAVLKDPAILGERERRRASPTVRLALNLAQAAVAAAALQPDEVSSIFATACADTHVIGQI